MKNKEVAWIIIAIILFEFVVIYPNYKSFSLEIIITPIIILLTSIISKKAVSGYFNIKIEHKIWEFQRFGFAKDSKLKKPFPIGLIFPLIISILTVGFLKPLTLLQFDVENDEKQRLLKRYGSYRKTEINDSDPAFTAVIGFYSLLILSLVAINLNYSILAKYAIFYGFWNLIPYGNLDGSKVFFGSVINYLILAIIYIIALLIVLI